MSRTPLPPGQARSVTLYVRVKPSAITLADPLRGDRSWSEVLREALFEWIDKEEQAVTNKTLATEIRAVLNRYSRENESDTPDFILTDYLLDALEAFEKAVAARQRWHSAPAEGPVLPADI